MKPYFIKVGYFLIFIFAILNFLGLKQTEFEIRQLDSTARILTTHAEAIQAAQEQPTLNAAAAAALTRADTQIAIASFSNENVAGEAKRLASLCNANIKEKSITASVSNDAVLEEMARRPNMYGRLVIPSVGVNVALFAAETAKTLEPELNFTVTKSGIVPDDGSYVPVTLGDVTVCIPVAAAGQGGCTVTYCSGNSTAAIGDYKIALVEGNTEDSVVTFQNDDKEILSGTRTMGEGLTLTVAAEAEEGQETEQEAVIEKLLADAVITDTAPATTVFGETVKDDVVIEADDGYLQLQLNDNTVLVSTFSFNYDKTVFSKTLNLPGGLTVRYGNVQDKETGYIPFVSTVNNRNIKILATSVKALQGFFQG